MMALALEIVVTVSVMPIKDYSEAGSCPQGLPLIWLKQIFRMIKQDLMAEAVSDEREKWSLLIPAEKKKQLMLLIGLGGLR